MGRRRAGAIQDRCTQRRRVSRRVASNARGYDGRASWLSRSIFRASARRLHQPRTPSPFPFRNSHSRTRHLSTRWRRNRAQALGCNIHRSKSRASAYCDETLEIRIPLHRRRKAGQTAPGPRPALAAIERCFQPNSWEPQDKRGQPRNAVALSLDSLNERKVTALQEPERLEQEPELQQRHPQPERPQQQPSSCAHDERQRVSSVHSTSSWKLSLQRDPQQPSHHLRPAQHEPQPPERTPPPAAPLTTRPQRAKQPDQRDSQHSLHAAPDRAGPTSIPRATKGPMQPQPTQRIL